jgi:integrase
MLKLYRRNTTWWMRGTVKGVLVHRTCGTEVKAVATEIAAAETSRILKEAVHGRAGTATFAKAALSYGERVSNQQARLVERLIEVIGMEVPLARIEQPFIEKLIADRCSNWQPSSVRRQVLSPIQCVLHHAERIIPGYRAPRLDKSDFPDSKRRTRWLTPDEAARLLAAARPTTRTQIMLQLYTGCRPSEAYGLRWADVDLSHRTVLFRDTKNGEDRTSPIPNALFLHLANLADRGELVCGGPFDKKTRRGHFHAARAAAGLGSDVTPHTLCHTFATWARRFGKADSRALLDTRRWKSENVANSYMKTDALGSTRALVEKLPKLG